MKKLTKFYAFMTLLFSVVMLTACGSDSKDDDSDMPDNTDIKSFIVGEWHTEIGDGSDVSYFSFASNGRCEIMSVYIDDNLNTEVEMGVGTYKINGNKLSIRVKWDDSDYYEEEGGTIVSITRNRMVIKDSYGDSEVLTRIED